MDTQGHINELENKINIMSAEEQNFINEYGNINIK